MRTIEVNSDLLQSNQKQVNRYELTLARGQTTPISAFMGQLKEYELICRNDNEEHASLFIGKRTTIIREYKRTSGLTVTFETGLLEIIDEWDPTDVIYYNRFFDWIISGIISAHYQWHFDLGIGSLNALQGKVSLASDDADLDFVNLTDV